MKLLSFSLLLLLMFNLNASIRALHTAATGMQTQEGAVNALSNNIANLPTTAFKKERVESETLYYQTIVEPGSHSSFQGRYNVGVQVGSGSKISAIRRDFKQGNPVLTNNPFDLMINGEGFFGVLLPNKSIRYTRDGSFNVNSQGTVVTRNGYVLLPTLNFPPGTKSVNITENGNVEAFVKGQLTPINIGKIPVFTFTNNVGLKAIGGNLYRETFASGQATSNIAGSRNSGVIRQGTLESSNVNIMVEMTDLIKAQRAYEMNSKVMKVADEMLGTVNTLR